MAKLTAETITHEQIRELRRIDAVDTYTARNALGLPLPRFDRYLFGPIERLTCAEWRAARACCAEILNQRNGGAK